MNADIARQLFDYDADAGVLRWRVARGPAASGAVAGSRHNKGYWAIGYQYRMYLAHRLIWLYVHGEWPNHQIDHRDGDRANNRLNNLRDVTQSVNQHNIRRARRSNRSTGILGAWPNKKGFQTRIVVNGKVRHIGTFKTAGEAHDAYIAAKRRGSELCPL